MDVIVLQGKPHVPAKQAAREFNYTPDYIGQLIRGGKVSGQKIGRSWYVDLETLKSHLKIEDTPGLKEDRSPSDRPIFLRPNERTTSPAMSPRPKEAMVEDRPAQQLFPRDLREEHTLLKYLHDEEPTFPVLRRKENPGGEVAEEDTVAIPIHRMKEPEMVIGTSLPSLTREEPGRNRREPPLLPAAAGATLSFLLATLLLAGASLFTSQKIVFDANRRVTTVSFLSAISLETLMANVFSAWGTLGKLRPD